MYWIGNFACDVGGSRILTLDKLKSQCSMSTRPYTYTPIKASGTGIRLCYSSETTVDARTGSNCICS